jgi:hypothetical protein
VSAQILDFHPGVNKTWETTKVGGIQVSKVQPLVDSGLIPVQCGSGKTMSLTMHGNGRTVVYEFRR